MDDADFIFHHVLDTEIEVRHGADVFAVVVGAVKIFIVKAGKMQHGFAHGLAGNRSGIDADAANAGLSFDNRDALAGFGALNGGALPTGS